MKLNRKNKWVFTNDELILFLQKYTDDIIKHSGLSLYDYIGNEFVESKVGKHYSFNDGTYVIADESKVKETLDKKINEINYQFNLK